MTTHKINRNKTATVCDKDIDELQDNEFISHTWKTRKTGELIVNCKYCLRWNKEIKKGLTKFYLGD